MTMQTCEGIIQEVFIGKEKPSQYGPCANFTLKIEDKLYVTYSGVESFKKKMKVGDKVRFKWNEEIDYNGVPQSKFTVKDNFENLTTPIPVPATSAFRSGYKPDPAKDARMVRGAAVRDAITMLTHNMSGSQIKFEHVQALANKIENFVYEAKGQEVSTEAPKAQNEPPINENLPIDNIPF